jgi:segregation and condensation protein B
VSEREAGTGGGPADVPDAEPDGAQAGSSEVGSVESSKSPATAEFSETAVDESEVPEAASWENIPIPADVLGSGLGRPGAASEAGNSGDSQDSGSSGEAGMVEETGESGPSGGTGDEAISTGVRESGIAAGEESAEAGEAQESGADGPAASGDDAGAQVPAAAAPGESESAEQPLPDLTEDDALEAALEALLLVVDVPAGEELLADTLGQPVARIRTALDRMSATYADARRGLDLRRVGDGWRFYTRDTYAPYVERYLLDGQRSKLTRAALETLAVIAYRQPVTRSRVAAVRGVNVDGVIRTLLARGLVEEAGADPETGGVLYCTTELFLERLGLSSLKDLPPLAPLLPEVDSIDDV